MASKEKWYVAPIARYLKQSMELRLLRLVSASGVSTAHSAKDLLKDGPLAPGEKASTRKEAEERIIALTIRAGGPAFDFEFWVPQSSVLEGWGF